jgi:hypothetical protein
MNKGIVRPYNIDYKANQKKSVVLIDCCLVNYDDMKVNGCTEHWIVQQLFDFVICLESAINEIFNLLKTSFFRTEGTFSFQESIVDDWSVLFTRSTISDAIDNLNEKGGQK